METQKQLSFKDILKIAAVSIAIVAVLFMIFFGGIRYQKRIGSVAEQYLQEQVDKYQQEADKWKDRYEASLEEKTTLLLNVDSLEMEITKLKKSYGKKITVVKSYSNPELERFFADRYGD